jgi:hypothetical protein
MEIGLEKCAKIVFKKRKLFRLQNVILATTEKCKSLNRENLGKEESEVLYQKTK